MFEKTTADKIVRIYWYVYKKYNNEIRVLRAFENEILIFDYVYTVVYFIQNYFERTLFFT